MTKGSNLNLTLDPSLLPRLSSFSVAGGPSSLSSTSSANKRNNIEERNNNQLCNNNISDVTVNDNVLLKTLDDCNDDTMLMHPSIH